MTGRNRSRLPKAWRNTSAEGQLLANHTQTFRTVTCTNAPIFNNLSRIVWHCAWSIEVPAKPSRRSASSNV
jgi:hypothetical protein